MAARRGQMAYTLVRGTAIRWMRFCDACREKYYEQVSKDREHCPLCGDLLKDGYIGVVFCGACSSETGMCQACGDNIGVDLKKAKKKRKRAEKK
jgi:rRNA maturation endonuclease Nob1